MAKLILIRGLPGSGKSTLAAQLGADRVVSADDFMVDASGEYSFHFTKLGHAHASCQQTTYEALIAGKTVAVANTFTQRWEMSAYIKMAQDLGAELEIVDIFDAGLSDHELAARNLHGVPVEVITKMRARYQEGV